MATEYSTNLTDLKLDIGMTIQKLQAGEELDMIEELFAINKAIHTILTRH